MIPDIAYERYVPTVIQVDSLKINVRDDIINDDPAFLTDQQSLLVGKQVYANCNIYNLIVDDEGVMINAALAQRTEIGNQYALAVNGDVFVTGQIIAGGSNFGVQYDPNGLFECISATQLTPGSLVEVIGVNSDLLQVSAATTAFSSAVFGVCSDVRPTANIDGTWSLQVQTAGIGVITCDGPIDIGDMITTSGIAGKGVRTWINGDIVDTAIHNYTIGKALQAVPAGVTQNIRCLFNVIKAPPLGSTQTLGVGGDGMWEMGSNETESIFYPGYITIGRDYASRSNNNPLNIVRSANRTIDHAQINMENTQASRFRAAIVGTSNASPVVFNTSPTTDIEFHAGRQQDYFQRMYTTGYCNTVYSQNSNTWTYIATTSEVPNYQNYPSANDAPHLRIGADGNIGIHTSSNPYISYNLRSSNIAITEQMALHVQGSTYSCNMLIWDYDTQTAKNIDDLYIRRLGKTFQANSIIPGAFADNGSYWFKSNLGVNGPPDSNYGLNVSGNAHFTQDIIVDGYSRLSNIICSTSATFLSDINANSDLIVSGSMLLEGGIFVSVLSNVDNNGTEHYTWQAIDFKPAGSQVTDLNHVGAGLSTPGRFGAGITSTDARALNALSSQFVVNKRNQILQGLSSNIWEIEIKDLSHSGYTPIAWIGHPIILNASQTNNANLYFATPSRDNIMYSNGASTNICFCPGRGTINGVDGSQAPTLSVCSDGKVGVGTDVAITEMTVFGTVTFTKGLSYYDATTEQSFGIGLWKIATLPSSSNIMGLTYYNPAVPYVGINAQPDLRYGVVMGSNVKIIGSLYSEDNSMLAQWYDGTDPVTLANNPIAPATQGIAYTWAQVGVGVSAPNADMAIKNNYGSNTTLRLIRSDTNSNISIEMWGNNGTWKAHMDDTTRRLDFGYDASNMYQVDNTYPTRPLFMIWDPVHNCPQTYIGCTFDVLTSSVASNIDKGASLIVSGGLSVIGDVNITGTYYANGKVVFNETAATPSDLGVDDVYIGGGNIVVSPNLGRSVIIGTPNELINQTNAPILRIYQNTTNPTIASFRTMMNEGLVEIYSYSTDQTLRFGVLDRSLRNTCTFAFMDGNNAPYMSFYPAANGNYVGYNTFSPQAMMHVTSVGNGSNMLRLTTTISDQNSTSAAPEMQFEKIYSASNNLPTSWKLSGPNTEWKEKFSLSFGSNGNDYEEVFAFTNDGCIGIGTSQPQYALDIVNNGDLGTLRLTNTGANPHILMQSASTSFGIDSNTDYRIYSNSNEFYIDAMQYNELMPIMHVNNVGNIGLRCDATSNYNIEIQGTINITDAIVLNGVPLFSATATLPFAFLRASSVYLQPDANSGGGVHVNTQTSLVSGNLFYIASGIGPGANANMMMYESFYPEAQIHLRTLADDGSSSNDMWRIGANGRDFYLELWANCGPDVTVNDSHVHYTRAFNLSPSTITPRYGLYDASINGNLIVNSATPFINFGSFASITANNSCNLEVLASAFTVPGLLNVTSNGVFIGTNNSNSVGLTVGTGQIFALDGTASLPTYSFASSSNTGLFNNSNSLSIAVNGVLSGQFTQSLLTVPSLTCSGQAAFGSNLVVSSNTGYVGIGTSIPQYPLHVYTGSNGIIFESYNSNAQISLRPTMPNSPVKTQWDICAVTQNFSITYDVPSASYNNTVLSIDRTGNTTIHGHMIIDERYAKLSLGSPQNIIGPGSTPELVGYSNNIVTNNKTFSVVGNDPGYSALTVGYSFNIGLNPPPIFNVTPNGICVNTVTSPAGVGLNVGSGQIWGVDGSASLPTYSFAGSSNTGIFHTANGMSISVNGILSSTFTSNGFSIPSLTCTGQVNLGSNGNGLVVSSNTQYIGIGTNAPAYPLHVVGESHFLGNLVCMSNMYVQLDMVVAGNTYTRFDQIVDSDKRLKSNLSNIDNALDRVSRLTGYTYTYDSAEKRSTGLIAQDVLEVLPEAVGTNPTSGMYGVEYGSMMGLIVEAIKSLKSEVEELKKRIPI